ncbi:hypothetical protein KCP69_12970 [Salmonella enterica subsp. enterica]|nr:hypothetical protein KCP69_12970 [Salmonella enterica subsp. enterica]
MNYLPARLSWLLLGIAAGLCRLSGCWRCVLAGDRYNHSSPNCARRRKRVCGRALG